MITITKPESTKLTIALPRELKERVKAKAEREGRNVTDIIMEAFAVYLAQDDTEARIEALEKRILELETKQ